MTVTPFRKESITTFDPFTVATLTNGMEVYILDKITYTDGAAPIVEAGEGWLIDPTDNFTPYSYTWDEGAPLALTPMINPPRVITPKNHVRVGFYSLSSGVLTFKFLYVPAEYITPNNYISIDDLPDDEDTYSASWHQYNVNKDTWKQPSIYYILLDGIRVSVQVFDQSGSDLYVLYSDTVDVARTCKVSAHTIIGFYSLEWCGEELEEVEHEDRVKDIERQENIKHIATCTPIKTPFMIDAMQKQGVNQGSAIQQENNNVE